MVRVFIIEDEEYIRKGLRIQLNELDRNLQIVGESASVNDALSKVEKDKPNLILLDIKLLDGSGFDFLEKVTFKKFKVIFITSYDKYAIKALKLNAVDYILKPIDIEELEQAIDKSIMLIQKDFKIQNSEKIIKLNFINGSQIINLEELMYCKSHKGYTTFYMKNKKQFLSSKPLKEYEKQLSINGFIKTHQSYFVNLNTIEKFDSKNRQLFLNGNTVVPVSARKLSTINSYFND